MNIAFLYTLKANESLFQPYIEKYLGGMPVTVTHHTNESLLQHAMEDGLTDQVAKAVQHSISEIAAQGADIIICTCSTIGELAEKTPDISSKVIRVDRPMAEAALQYESILVLAAIASTLEPTISLLQSVIQTNEANHCPQRIIETSVIPEAWPYYFSGNTEMYTRKIAGYINSIQAGPRAILLAQASMAPAVELCKENQFEILTSPELCLRYLAQQVSQYA
ncbi:hypothetical protein [Photobacterium sp. OFAV2-7]|uniref:hypothetical protein n=1 Tax=Photobacterium sp. OFAV2-7 TaxID=2917748 RepID=UPI001EF52AB9|nr:hypothetical protein [Photobacterium sp. OFAV2-7]MCG7588147.1 hypothetical protein [Photobacterium sp. OFAV2-7]